jgi:hypothetical protein
MSDTAPSCDSQPVPPGGKPATDPKKPSSVSEAIMLLLFGGAVSGILYIWFPRVALTVMILCALSTTFSIAKGAGRVAVGLLGAAGVVTLLAGYLTAPARHYAKAERLVAAKEYGDAVSILSDLGQYRDAPAKLAHLRDTLTAEAKAKLDQARSQIESQPKMAALGARSVELDEDLLGAEAYKELRTDANQIAQAAEREIQWPSALRFDLPAVLAMPRDRARATLGKPSRSAADSDRYLFGNLAFETVYENGKVTVASLTRSGGSLTPGELRAHLSVPPGEVVTAGARRFHVRFVGGEVYFEDEAFVAERERLKKSADAQAMLGRRKLVAAEMEKNLLSSGIDGYVRLAGKSQTMLAIRSPACGRPFVYNLTQDGKADDFCAIGFKRIECTDSFAGVAGVDLNCP